MKVSAIYVRAVREILQQPGSVDIVDSVSGITLMTINKNTIIVEDGKIILPTITMLECDR